MNAGVMGATSPIQRHRVTSVSRTSGGGVPSRRTTRRRECVTSYPSSVRRPKAPFKRLCRKAVSALSRETPASYATRRSSCSSALSTSSASGLRSVASLIRYRRWRARCDAVPVVSLRPPKSASRHSDTPDRHSVSVTQRVGCRRASRKAPTTGNDASQFINCVEALA